MAKKQLIIMDEVDGMAGGDRGGVAQLISFIKKTQVRYGAVVMQHAYFRIYFSCIDRGLMRGRVDYIGSHHLHL